jgi:dipicolinate synthase subunit B
MMLLKGIKIGYAFTGAYCVFDQSFPQLERLVNEGAEVIPIASSQVSVTNSRYGKASDFLARMNKITGNAAIQTIVEAEIYNKNQSPMDLLAISPCTGCSLSKLADGATDTPVLMMAKELYRNNKPVVLGIATNDGLGISAKSIGVLLSTKNTYFIPFGQDNPIDKPNSLVAKFELTVPAVIEALKKDQLQPVLEKF